MQAVIALPGVREIQGMNRPVCGVSVLTRLIANPFRSGASRVLLVLPPEWTHRWLLLHLDPGVVDPGLIQTVEIGRVFNPNCARDWRAIQHCLDERFLWLPSDYIVTKPALTGLLATATRYPKTSLRLSEAGGSGKEQDAGAGKLKPGPDPFEVPCVLLKKEQVVGRPASVPLVIKGPLGVRVGSAAEIRKIEAALVRQSGKVTDGIYSRFNRMLCRPAVRWLSHTRVTPNMVTFGGLAVAILSGLCFAAGGWLWGIAGAALFFISGLFDEIDGMLARLRFQESSFGCWLETMVDYSTYLLIFAGMTAGGYREGGKTYLFLGAALAFGLMLSFILISIQRMLAAPPDRPNEYSRRYLAALEKDSRNPVSRIVRQLQFLTKKGVLVHYLLLFAVLNLLPVLLLLAVVGANVTWVVTLYLNRRLFLSPQASKRRLGPHCVALAEVEK